MGTTGTGWIEPQSADSLEYLWNGDTAEVTIQYSYLPSWISFLVDKQRAEDAGQALFDAVHERWSQLPADARPKLFAYGLSLGSFAQQAAFPRRRGRHLADRRRGVRRHAQLHAALARRRGEPRRRQPAVAARLRAGADGPLRRVAEDYAQPPGPWNEPRLLYLQHASDPVVWWYRSILWSRPDWLAEPRGPGRQHRRASGSRSSRSAQVTVDQFHGTGVPNGHGHNYGNMMASAWAQLGGRRAGPTPTRRGCRS